MLVLDASTAILLARIDLLRATAERAEVWMAEAAFMEVTVKECDDARIVLRLAEEGRIRRAAVRGRTREILHDFRLHAGEAESIVLALERKATCGTDDGPAIRCCKALGVPFTSAVGLLVGMVERRGIEGSLALELLDKLQRFGRYGARILEDAGRRIRAAGSGGTS